MSGDMEVERAEVTRRQFMRSAGVTAAGVAAIAASSTVQAQTVAPRIIAQPEESPIVLPADAVIRRDDVVLFQGDSITDAGRDRAATAPNSRPAMGGGYAWMAGFQLLTDRPGDNLQVLNRGISGNKVYQLAERWDADCLALKPNVLSILIGVNDFWHKTKSGYAGTLEIYEADYRALVERTKQALPDVRLVICEPFALKVGAVDDTWFPDFDGYRAAAKEIAHDVGAVFVPFQSLLDEAIKIAPPETWAADGVHPSPDGAALMAHGWLKAVGA